MHLKPHKHAVTAGDEAIHMKPDVVCFHAFQISRQFHRSRCGNVRNLIVLVEVTVEETKHVKLTGACAAYIEDAANVTVATRTAAVGKTQQLRRAVSEHVSRRCVLTPKNRDNSIRPLAVVKKGTANMSEPIQVPKGATTGSINCHRCILEPKWHKTQAAPTTKPPTNQTVGFTITTRQASGLVSRLPGHSATPVVTKAETRKTEKTESDKTRTA